MRGFTIAAIVIGIFSVYFLSEAPAENKPLSSTAKIIDWPTKNDLSLQKFDKSLRKLNDRFQASELDTQRLSELLVDGPQAVLNADWDPETRAILDQLKQEVNERQKHYFEKDGYPEDYFDQNLEPQEVWVVERANELRSQSVLGPTQEQLLERLKSHTKIQDDDLRELADSCGDDRSCIENSIFEIIDANHQLTERQFDLISKYF